MKLIIAGGRDYVFTLNDIYLLDSIKGITEVVSGKCSGADKCGESWAESKGIPVEPFPADWNKYPKGAAGPIRNRQMAKYADAVALFPGDRGTRSMYNEAKKEGLEIYDFRVG